MRINKSDTIVTEEEEKVVDPRHKASKKFDDEFQQMMQVLININKLRERY